MLLNKFSNKLQHIFVYVRTSVPFAGGRRWSSLSARKLVAAHVASVKGLSNKLPNLFGNMWPGWKHH